MIVATPKKTTVLFALDNSDGSKHAMDWSLDNLINPETHKLVLLTVVEAIPEASVYSGSGFDDLALYTASEDISVAKEKVLEEATLVLKSYEKLVRKKMSGYKNELDIELIVSMGDAKDQILDCAGNLKADMIVVGSYSKGTIKRAFLGSVGDHLCHHAECPVLVIRNPCHNENHKNE